VRFLSPQRSKKCAPKPKTHRLLHPAALKIGLFSRSDANSTVPKRVGFGLKNRVARCLVDCGKSTSHHATSYVNGARIQFGPKLKSLPAPT
jgi:hypothetical protein